MSSAASKITSGAKKVGSGAESVWTDFKTFINKGNVVDLAVGLVMGAAFTTVVNSFVNDLISPIIGLIFQVNLAFAYLPMKCAANVTIPCNDVNQITKTYPTPKQANDAGIVTWNYGSFLQAVINFIIISIVLFFIVKAYVTAFHRKGPASTKICMFCTKDIPIKAIRCPHCTSQIPNRVDDATDETSLLETKIEA